MAPGSLVKLRRICLALPQATEVEAWGTATFRCGRIFAMYSTADDTVHSGGRPGVWLKAGPGDQALMIRSDPRRFFRPPYVGAAGWIGVRLDDDPPWDEIAILVEESWRLIAPKKVLKAHGAGTAIAAAPSPRRSPTKPTPNASVRRSPAAKKK